MALLDAFRLASKISAEGQSSKATVQKGVRSPWTTGSLAPWVIADIFGEEFRPVSRADAMRVPAIVKGRALICGMLSRHPLAKFARDQRVDPEPWMYRTSDGVPPAQRMLWTLDDLIFTGLSLWAVERGTRDQVTDARRLPPDWWEITPDLDILVNGQEVRRDSVILIEGPQDGLLDIAADDIRAARAMVRAWASRVTSPVPLVELHNTDPNADLSGAEVEDLIESWESARKSGGATGYTPAQIETKVHGEASAELFVEGRNASRLDFANHLNIPAALLEGSMATASLTYSTVEGRRNELVDYSLSYWANPIEARLSQDDVTPRGSRVVFDLSDLLNPTQSPTGPILED